MSLTIPKKPDNVTWTDDQWKAIWAKGQDILVAAAAGSGKTAVLVERIIQKILSNDDPVDVDELLVVTFTNASAAEMRNRIGEALEKAIQNDPHSKRLRKQLSLLNRASISTLHSFCLEVVRKYYYKIDIDPSFRIADTTESLLLRDEVMEQLFEEEYGKENNDAFFHLVDMFSNDRSDLALQEMIGKIYDFAISNPSPEMFLQKMVQMYDVPDKMKIDDLPFMESLFSYINIQLQGAKSITEQGLALTKLPGGPLPREETFSFDLEIIHDLLQAKEESWETLYEAMNRVKFPTLKSCRGDQYDPELVEQSKNLRNKAKKIIQDLKEELFSRKPESFLRDLKEMAPAIEMLARLVKTFGERFREAKLEKGIVDFSDLEHFCLQILQDEDEDGEMVPSDVALSYQKQFKEVFVDEYQDTNMVQEAILQLVTKGSEKEGNMFMVGDVKQSIYRFRLAEPTLFMNKYNRFTKDGKDSGLKIDLSQNFRSRKEVLDGTNYLFKQLMDRTIGEIEYDEAAMLKKGAPYPEEDEYPIELLLIDTAKEEKNEEEDFVELEQSRLEAKLLANKIKSLIENRTKIYDPKTKKYRPIQYRDIVILHRSLTWAPEMMDEFKEASVPLYVDLSKGYFEATEVSIMLSLLKVIDNPFQDIPLVAVLRSPIVGLNEEQLALIRMEDRKNSYYEALCRFARKRHTGNTEKIGKKVSHFLNELNKWRTFARRGDLSDLIWIIYRETRFFDFVGGLPGGKQRQANLQALYDRARAYESTSFRGLFRFLRFIERMKERGDDLGVARALSEGEDVVRLMTIHSSKGLEFPVVFIAGVGRKFNMKDLHGSYLLDKELGFATRYVNVEKRITLPSLAQIAFRRKKKMEMLAEEMRVFYVGMTRAKEKLYIVGTGEELKKKVENWLEITRHDKWLLNDFDRFSANSYIDWIIPSLIRHKDCAPLRNEDVRLDIPKEILNHPSKWKVEWVSEEEILIEEETVQDDEHFFKQVYRGKPVDHESKWKDVIEQKLSWVYPYEQATVFRSKQSVSEVKRQREIITEDSGMDIRRKFTTPLFKRPMFMTEKKLTPAEKGTVMHTIMQHINLTHVSESDINIQIEEMIKKEILTEEQVEEIEVNQIASFFETELGKRLMHAPKLKREVPFSAAFEAKEIYPNWSQDREHVLIQGVIDCLFEDDQGIVLLDYKTDQIYDRFKGGFEQAKPILTKRYEVQINLYAKAVEQTLRKKITEKYLYFFDGSHLIQL